jgi:flagellar motor switch protein FliN
MSQSPNTNEGAAAAPDAAWLVQEWADCFAGIVQSMTDERPEVRGVEFDGFPEDVLWWEQPFSAVRDAGLWVGAPQSAWQLLGERALQAAGVDSVELGEAKSTYLEILSQALSSVASALTRLLDSEVTCRPGSEQSTPPAAAEFAALEFTFASGPMPPLFVGVPDALMRGLDKAAGAQAQEEVEQASAGVPVSQPLNAMAAAVGISASSAVPPSSKTFDLLLEVELPVSVSFGRAQLPLRDVLKLATGSIIELNRGVVEPVDIIVNNCVIARGEVVVVDGNYGVRIRQIIPKEERLRTLK